MLDTVLAQLRFATSVTFGTRFSVRSLDRLIAALRETRQEFGPLGVEGGALLREQLLDAATRQEIQLRLFRKQAVRAAKETSYYRSLFEKLDLNPAHLRYEEIALLPRTPKAALQANPDAFVCQSARPIFRAMTTGTTGWPTSVSFSAYELQVYSALGAIAAFLSHDFDENDIVQISTSSRGTLGNLCLAGACAHVGAMVYPAGLVEPAQALAWLAEKRHLAGKKDRTSVLATYPSYLGALIEEGLRLGYRPTDFGVQRLIVGGEVVTEGLKARSQQLFGAVNWVEGYGMTELWPFGARRCLEGHLHFDISQGLLEVFNPETGEAARPGEIGMIVATPFPPYRETTLVLRYDTEDVVEALPEALSCPLRHLPATSTLLGKLSLATHHESGWTFPRSILEALEEIEEVPLPARYSCWAVPGGVALDVVARTESQSTYRKILASLEQHGIPVCRLHLVMNRSQLESPAPLRGDLREQMFSLPGRERTRASATLLPNSHSMHR